MNISTSNEENSNITLSCGQPSGEVADRAQLASPESDDAKKGNEEKIVSENTEKGSSVEKDNVQKSVPVALADESDEHAASGTESSDAKDKADMSQEKNGTTEAPAETPAVIVEEAESKNAGDKPAVAEPAKKRTRKKWKKPVGKPNRPLSAYNLYFQKERAIMLGDAAEKVDQEPGKKRVHRKTHGKIGFAEMAKIIGAKWKKLPEEEKEEFVQIAAKKKEQYAIDLEKWREEQKKKAIMNSMGPGPKSKMGRFSVDDDDLVQQIAEDRENLLRQHQAFRMQMMQEMQVGHLSRLPGEGHGRQMPTIEYLRNMQDDRTGQFFGRNRNGAPSSLFSHYPSAAEGSGRDLYEQMAAMSSVPEGQGGDSDQYRHVKMARGTSNSTNNPMDGSMSYNGIGMVPMTDRGPQMPPNSASHHHYEMDRYQHMRHQNQMYGSYGQRGMTSREGPSYHRFQQHSQYN